MSNFNPPSADAYGKSLKGFGVSLLVSDVAASMDFATRILGATVFFSTDKFAAMKLLGTDFMFHHDDTYRHNPLHGFLAGDASRGVGVELRCYGVDPDLAEAKARELGYVVLGGSLDKPHGLRECIILDSDGFAWLPSIHLKI